VLADHGRSPTDRHRHVLAGRNSRLDTLQAAFLSARLSRLDDENRRRRAAIARYRDGLPPSLDLIDQDPRADSVHHLAVVRSADRSGLTRRLTAAGIGWGVHYPVPCHRQPAFAAFGGDCPVADDAAARIVSLPLSPSITDEEVDRVCAVAGEALP
jgi:dTDP-4-amino-4,6-dideoxygalactose transaminase